MKTPITIFLLATLFFLPYPSQGRGTDYLLHAGVNAYEAENFDSAKQFFEEIPLERRTASIFQNLALTEARLGNLGPCVLNLRRALEMDPGNREMIISLNELLREVELPPLSRSWWSSLAQIFAYEHWGFIGAFCLWIAIAGAIFARFREKYRRRMIPIVFLFAICAALSGLSMWELSREEREAIVLRDTATYPIPSSNAPTSGFLRAGSSVYFYGEQRKMASILAPGGKKVFIRSDDCERILDLADDSRF
jgi:hypothetical protein